jgi:hypothetical protein
MKRMVVCCVLLFASCKTVDGRRERVAANLSPPVSTLPSSNAVEQGASEAPTVTKIGKIKELYGKLGAQLLVSSDPANQNLGTFAHAISKAPDAAVERYITSGYSQSAYVALESGFDLSTPALLYKPETGLAAISLISFGAISTFGVGFYGITHKDWRAVPAVAVGIAELVIGKHLLDEQSANNKSDSKNIVLASGIIDVLVGVGMVTLNSYYYYTAAYQQKLLEQYKNREGKIPQFPSFNAYVASLSNEERLKLIDEMKSLSSTNKDAGKSFVSGQYEVVSLRIAAIHKELEVKQSVLDTLQRTDPTALNEEWKKLSSDKFVEKIRSLEQEAKVAKGTVDKLRTEFSAIEKPKTMYTANVQKGIFAGVAQVALGALAIYSSQTSKAFSLTNTPTPMEYLQQINQLIANY